VPHPLERRRGGIASDPVEQAGPVRSRDRESRTRGELARFRGARPPLSGCSWLLAVGVEQRCRLSVRACWHVCIETGTGARRGGLAGADTFTVNYFSVGL